jgi:hypothetical protein
VIFWVKGITERIIEVKGISDGWGGRWVGCEGQAACLSTTPPILTPDLFIKDFKNRKWVIYPLVMSKLYQYLHCSAPVTC